MSIDEQGRLAPRRFEPKPVVLEPEVVPPSSEDFARAKKRRLLGGLGVGVMTAGAVACFVLAGQLGSAKGDSTVTEKDTQAVFLLQSDIALLKAQSQALPSTAVVERSLVTAFSAAESVANFQDNYRILATKVKDGSLDAGETFYTASDLSPYFNAGVDKAQLQPWYLLAADKSVPVGAGLPVSFNSGFDWVAQQPNSVDENRQIKVSWLALERNVPVDSSARVLAWASADYDMTSKTFVHLSTGVTALGAQSQLTAVVK